MSSLAKGAKLLDSDDDDKADNAGLSINRAYADRYDNWRRLEEMQKLKDRCGEVNDNDNDEESSSSSEEEVEWTSTSEKNFLKTLAALKSNNSKIYNVNEEFFKMDDNASTSTSSDKKSTESKSEKKKMFLKDYERKLILERGGQIDESDDDDEQQRHDVGYYQRQEENKRQLKKALSIVDDDDDSLFTKRIKSDDQLKQEEDDYYEWLKGQKSDNDTHVDKSDRQQLMALREIWSDPNLDNDERFLRDYLLNKQYEPNDSSVNEIPTYDEIVNDDDDEEQLEKERQFERKYNFRYEEPDQEFIKQYPRTVNESLRRSDDRRKTQRDSYKERKEKEKQRKRDDIRELKAMKRKEIELKLDKLRRIIGDDQMPLSIDDIDGDFDPTEYDRRMNAAFSDQYYTAADENEEKPTFSHSEDEDEIDGGDLPDYDNFPISTVDSKHVDQESIQIKDEEEATSSFRGRKGRKRRRNNQFTEAVSRQKPIFNPEEKTFEEYLNEYYRLDYEDIIGGDTITRFKYRTVPANDFGLTTDEILTADDRQLNAWVSLKKATQYRSDREEQYDIQAYEKKARDAARKKRIFSKDFGEKTTKKKKKNSKIDAYASVAETVEHHKSEKSQPINTIVKSLIITESAPLPTIKRKRKRKNSKKSAINGGAADKSSQIVSDERLKAYGVNPKKFRNRLQRKKPTNGINNSNQ